MSPFPFTIENPSKETLAFLIFYYDKSERLMEKALIPGGIEVPLCPSKDSTFLDGIFALQPKSSLTVEEKDLGLLNWTKTKTIYLSIFRPTPGSYSTKGKFLILDKNNLCAPLKVSICGTNLEGTLKNNAACIPHTFAPSGNQVMNPNLYVGPRPWSSTFKVNDMRNSFADHKTPFECLWIEKPFLSDPKYNSELRKKTQVFETASHNCYQ